MALVRWLHRMGNRRHRKSPPAFTSARPARLHGLDGLPRRRLLLPEATKVELRPIEVINETQVPPVQARITIILVTVSALHFQGCGILPANGDLPG